ncbi:fungal-specific transcription factor domain-containing protein [Xylariales sp. PMI_506]|nr:fungal-specific transcription factor domain-containing protein [Xylariales sp. PMI_506]
MEEGTRGQPGPASPEPSSATSEKHPAPLGPPGSQDPALNKRRRGLGVVTPNACTECRKKRAKCDGQTPCGRCKAQKDVECVYEIPVRQSKENLRNEIEQLRSKQRHSDFVFSALVRPELWEEVLARLRNGQSVESISDWLGGTLPSGGGTLPSFASSNTESRPGGGVTLPPISGLTYASTSATSGPYGSVSLGAQLNQRQDYDRNSPWAFSSQSQTQSTRSDSHPDIMQWTADAGSGPQNRVGSWVLDQSEGTHPRGANQVLTPLGPPDLKIPPANWTNITDDIALVQHLLALYFCWEYPTFASLSKEHFLKDFLDGRNRYCSPILVNALLALGCRFSSQPKTRALPNDPSTSGDHFFAEALRLLYRETNHNNLTTIQALGIMSIREASCGRDSESWYYAGQSVRMAVEMGLHRLNDIGDEDELAVQAATFWGAFALDHAWSLATGSLPQCSCFPHLPPKPAIIDDIEASLWIPYTDDGSNRLGAPLQRSCEQPSNVRSVYRCFCELSELVHQSLYVLHSPGRPVTSRDLLNIYTQYLNWYDSIPEVLRLGQNFTPAVLFAHMYYHFAILLLFRPLIKLRIIGSSLLPRDVCAQAADAIQGLLRSYSQLYTLRRTPSFVPYFVLTSAIMHLAVGALKTPGQDTSPSTVTGHKSETEGDLSQSHPRPSTSSTNADPPSPSSTSTAKLNPRVTEAINQGIADLTEMAPCHHFAEQALHILRYLAKKWNIEVNIPPPQQVLSKEDADTLIRPQTSSLNFFAPSVMEDDFLCTWGMPSQPSLAADIVSIATEAAAENAGASSQPFRSPSQSGPLGGIENPPTQARGDPLGSDIEPRMGVGPAAQLAKSVENPLFWPFPMQGRPMLPSGKKLKEAGFEFL